jgi:hypothetical protein
MWVIPPLLRPGRAIESESRHQEEEMTTDTADIIGTAPGLDTKTAEYAISLRFPDSGTIGLMGLDPQTQAG